MPYPSENFDSYSNGAINGLNGGSGWAAGWVDADNAYVVQSSIVHSSPRAAKGTGDGTRHDLYRKFPSFSTDNQIFTYYVYIDGNSSGNWDLSLLKFGEADVAAGIQFRSGDSTIRLISTDGTPPWTVIQSYSPGQWYKIDLKLNFTAQTYQVQIDNGGYTSSFAFWITSSFVDTFIVIGENPGSGNDVYFDDLADTTVVATDFTFTTDAIVKAANTQTVLTDAIVRAVRFTPDLSFRSNTAPFDLLTSLLYKQSRTEAPNDLPVLDGEVSDDVLFRIYNNFMLNDDVGDAINIQLTTYDQMITPIESHTCSILPVSQSWLHVMENGFGEGSSGGGLLTFFEGEDTAVGGCPPGANFYTPEQGSDGSTINKIRAGGTGSGLGFMEIKSYVRPSPMPPNETFLFTISVSYDFIL